MTYKSFPFDFLPDGVTQQEVREDDGSELFRLAIPDGVDGWPGSTAMQVSVAAGGSAVSVAPGTAGVRGFCCVITEAEQVPVPGADAQTRTDRVTLRLDRSANTLKPFLVDGTPGSGAPAFKRDANNWDLPLYKVTRATTGALSVEDERDWRDARFQLCESTNRPSYPRLGDFAFETDTKRLLRYDGSGWQVWYGPVRSGKVTLEPRWPDYWHPSYDIVVYRIDDEVYLRINVERRTRSTDPGNPDASFPLIVTLPKQFRPPINWQPVFYGDGGRSGIAEIGYNTGEVKLIAGDEIPAGVNVHISTSFPATA